MIVQEKMKNGVDLEKLGATIEAIQETPTLAKFQFRAKNDWVDGGHCVTNVKSFYGAGEEDSTRQETFSMVADHPEVLLGKDLGPNPAEIVLHALGSCLTAAMVYHASAQGIEIEEMEAKLHGNLDLQGFLGLDPTKRKGFEGIKVTYKVKSNATEEQLRELSKFSPVYDIVTNPVPVSIEFEK